MKTCKICGRTITYLRTDKKKKRVICRKTSCGKELKRQAFNRYKKKNKERIKEYGRKYYKTWIKPERNAD